ncbi:MAG: undecaprenyl-phosphate glucose phosphotransferase [Leptospiraceae bacterium]|nr:undecaprenyl-phosphate glucose phosphotransferase [Leptospiraceae bacterium]
MLKERNQTFKLMFIGLDLSISLIGFWLAFTLRYVLDSNFYFNWTNYIILSLVLSVTQVLAFISIDLYHPRRGLAFYDELAVIASGVVLNLLFILSLLFFFRGEIRGESFSRLFVGYYVLISIFLTALVHYFFRLFLMKLREKGYNLRKVIIIGTGKTAERITEVIQKHKIYGYKIAGYIKSISRTQVRADFTILGNLKDIEKILSEQKPDILIYAKEFADGENLREIIDYCDHENIELKIIPEFIEFIAAKGRVEGMDGVPIISIRDIPIRMGYNRFIKRSFDFLFSLTFILVFSPIYIIIALLVKLTSEGDIFIRQERVGLDNKSFNMLKFRTMYTQAKADSDTIWTKKDDPRVTPVGSVLRKLSIDEIPQFFNVLMGSMSVVGPRPERPFFVEKFKNEHHQYMRRHAVKAGITGWAQVNGLRGDTSIEKRIEADIYYIENWSIFFDMKIILLTPFTGLVNKNAY